MTHMVALLRNVSFFPGTFLIYKQKMLREAQILAIVFYIEPKKTFTYAFKDS